MGLRHRLVMPQRQLAGRVTGRVMASADSDTRGAGAAGGRLTGERCDCGIELEIEHK